MSGKIPILSNKTGKSATKKVAGKGSAQGSAAANADYYKMMGALIGHHRRLAGLTQQQLAERIKMTRGSITNIESGIQTPQPKALGEIAEVLKVRVDRLFPSPESAAKDYEKTLESLPADKREAIERFVGRI